MRLLLLADASSIHTIRWANSLSEQNIEILLLTLSEYSIKNFNPQIEIKSLNISKKIKNKSDGNFSKILYLISLYKILHLYRKFKPNIVHAHYASSYGFLASILKLKPLVISAWGSDIYTFPNKNFLNKIILKYTLKNTEHLLSTSHVMVKQISSYTNEKEIRVIPFGINTEKFAPAMMPTKSENEIVIGTIKSLEDTYGIDTLLKAFQILILENPQIKLKLLIVGSGSKFNELQNLAHKLDIARFTEFVGFVEHSIIQEFHRKLDICVYLSRQESFGVSVLESSSCGLPIVASNVGGLLEVVKDNQSGFLVEPNNPRAAAEKIQKLIDNKNLRISLGQFGRNFVVHNYSWNNSVERMLDVYKEILT
jgi:glycosyltransferase involved in cell wall biosynthesis